MLTAYQNVADTLHAIDADARTLRAASDAAQATSRSFDVAKRQRELGQVGYIAVLVAEQAYRQASISLIQARGSRYSDTVALMLALGGDWQHQSATPAAIPG